MQHVDINPRIEVNEAQGLSLTFWGANIPNKDILDQVKTVEELLRVATLLDTPTGVVRFQIPGDDVPVRTVQVSDNPSP